MESLRRIRGKLFLPLAVQAPNGDLVYLDSGRSVEVLLTGDAEDLLAIELETLVSQAGRANDED